MNERDTVWLAPPFGQGEPREVDATPEVLTPLLVAGWGPGRPAGNNEEVTTDVHD
jgi:hypothetical protein